MFENDEIVVNEATEKEAVENTADQAKAEEVIETKPAAKVFTQDEVNEIVKKRNARTEKNIRREYEKKYGELEEVLRAGSGAQTVEEMTSMFKGHYESKGVKFQEKPQYSDKEIAALASSDASEIIDSGYDEVVEEVNRLAKIGLANMTAREKATFKVLAEHRQSVEREQKRTSELSEINANPDIFNSAEYKEYRGLYNPNVSEKVIYGNFMKERPKKEIQTMGSMKNNAQDGGIKEFYTPEEAKKFTQAEINSNPALVEAIERSMRKWK